MNKTLMDNSAARPWSAIASALFVLVLITGLTIGLATQQAAAEQTTITLKVSGMTCASCPYMVRRSLTAIDGVKEAKVSLQTARAIVTFDDAKTSIAAMTKATGEAGFPSVLNESDAATQMPNANASVARSAPKTRGSN